MENQKQEALILREQAKQQLLEIKNIDEAVSYVNKVKAIETYCKAVKEDNEIVKIVAEQKIRSMRLAGQILQQTDLSTNIGSNQHVLPDKKPRLSDLGISKNESSTYQKIAAIPEDEFEEEMEQAKNGSTTSDITVTRFKNKNKSSKNNNDITNQINDEKMLRKYARALGFKVQVLKPDLIVLSKRSKDLNKIKSLYN